MIHNFSQTSHFSVKIIFDRISVTLVNKIQTYRQINVRELLEWSFAQAPMMPVSIHLSKNKEITKINIILLNLKFCLEYKTYNKAIKVI